MLAPKLSSSSSAFGLLTNRIVKPLGATGRKADIQILFLHSISRILFVDSFTPRLTSGLQDPPSLASSKVSDEQHHQTLCSFVSQLLCRHTSVSGCHSEAPSEHPVVFLFWTFIAIWYPSWSQKDFFVWFCKKNPKKTNKLNIVLVSLYLLHTSRILYSTSQ